jgi:hypothetical protein
MKNWQLQKLLHSEVDKSAVRWSKSSSRIY